MYSDGDVIHVLADVDIEVYEDDEIPHIHIADAIYHTVLEKTKKEKAVLQPGEYTIRLMASIVCEGNDNAVSDSDD